MRGRVHRRLRLVVERASEEEQIVIAAKVELLQKHGPTLPRPHSDVIVTSRHSNMKELRGKAGESLLRSVCVRPAPHGDSADRRRQVGERALV